MYVSASFYPGVLSEAHGTISTVVNLLEAHHNSNFQAVVASLREKKKIILFHM